MVLMFWRRMTPIDSDKGKELFQQAQQAFDLADYDKALSLAFAARDAYDKSKDAEGMGYASSLAGKVLVALGQLDTAVENYVQAVSQLRVADDEMEALVTLAETQRAEGNAEAAFAMVQRTYGLLKKMSDSPKLARWLYRTGYGFYEAEDWEQAATVFRAALEQAEKQADLALQTSTLLELANTLGQMERMDEARALFERSATQAELTGDKSALATALHGQAVTYVALGQAEPAIDLFNASLRLKRKLGDTVGVAHTLYELGAMHAYLGRCEQALPLLERSVAMYESIAAPELEVARAGLNGYALGAC